MISLELAQSLMSYAITWAQENDRDIAIAVVDTAGELIAFSRMDACSPQSCLLAKNKAYTAARDRQKTSVHTKLLIFGLIRASQVWPAAFPCSTMMPLLLEGLV